MIQFTVIGEPTAKGRPRFNRFSGRAYTPAKTAEGERDFKVQALPFAPKAPLTVPLCVTMRVFRQKPKHMPKSRTHCTTKPDLDNYIKCLDALNGIFWVDDSQIIELRATKEYGTNPRTEITIEEVGEYGHSKSTVA